jgi:DNA-binding GntR family transcriptional regulator
MKTTAVDKAYGWLRERILDGTLSPGSFIDEATVCEATGVSRTPAREAFNRLEGERYLTLVPRRGAQVRELNSRDLHDAFNARLMIESHVAREFCAARMQVPASMRQHLQAMDEITDFTDREATLAYLNADLEFHAAFVRTLGNRAIDGFFESLRRANSLGAARRAELLRTDRFLNMNRSQHHALVAGLEKYDTDAVLEVLRQHLHLSNADFPKYL